MSALAPLVVEPVLLHEETESALVQHHFVAGEGFHLEIGVAFEEDHLVLDGELAVLRDLVALVEGDGVSSITR